MTSDEHSRVTSYLEWSDKGKAGLGRYVVGLLAVFVVFFVLAGLGSFPVTILDPEYKDSLIESNLAIMLVFVIPFIGIPWVTHLVHKRPYWSVGWTSRSFEGWNLAMGFAVSTVVGLLAVVLVGAVGAVELDWVGIDWGAWLPLFAIGVVGLFVQTSSRRCSFPGIPHAVRATIQQEPLGLPHHPRGPVRAPPHLQCGRPGWGTLGDGALLRLRTSVRLGRLPHRVAVDGNWSHFSNNLSGMAP